MATVRVKPDVVAVVFDENGEPIPLRPDMAFDTNDWIVKHHPWAFQQDADSLSPKRRISSIKVEQTTQAPGETR
jgi:hypothetical protein